MSSERKPWMIPIQYNDDRWAEPTPKQEQRRSGEDQIDDVRDASDVEELLRRPDVKEEREYECNDVTPVDYSRGPHDTEFGVDEKDFDAPDNNPVPYERGPHDEEFGADDED